MLQKLLKFIGIDSASIRNSKILKLGGFFVIFMSAIAVAGYFLLPEKQGNESVNIHTSKEQKNHMKKYNFDDIDSLFGWASIICFSLAGFLEPSQPKRDGRFKTGFKNNAVIRKKSKEEMLVQRLLILFGAIFGFFWYFFSK